MKVEKTLAILVLISLIIKYMGISAGGPLSIVLIGTLSVVYLPGGFYFFSDKGIKNQNVLLSIFSGIVASLFAMVLLFKTMYWVGGRPMLLVSCVLVPFLTLLIWLMGMKPKDELVGYYKAMKFRFAIFTVLTFLMLMIPSESLIQFQYRNEPRKAELAVRSYQGTITPEEEVELRGLHQKN